jgi:hypothetical protein
MSSSFDLLLRDRLPASHEGLHLVRGEDAIFDGAPEQSTQ